jgi:hypothetical protein
MSYVIVLYDIPDMHRELTPTDCRYILLNKLLWMWIWTSWHHIQFTMYSVQWHTAEGITAHPSHHRCTMRYTLCTMHYTLYTIHYALCIYLKQNLSERWSYSSYSSSSFSLIKLCEKGNRGTGVSGCEASCQFQGSRLSGSQAHRVLWGITHCVLRVGYGVWRMTYGVWRMAYDVWGMAYDVWGMA